MRYRVFKSISRVCLRLVGLALAALLPPILVAQARPASDFKVLHAFAGVPDGAIPNGPLIQDAEGNLYGVTQQGGANNCDPGSFEGCGVVFKIDKNNNETILYAFSGGADGALPESGVISDSSGNLYGTTEAGGDYSCPQSSFGIGCGVVFKLTPGKKGWKESVLHTFKGGSDGARSSAGLTFDASGNLYGVTLLGGDVTNCNPPSGCGVVFKLTPGKNGWEESILHRISSETDGWASLSTLIRDEHGNLYNTASQGGIDSVGTVYKVSKAGTVAVLHTFTGETDGGVPETSLIFDAKGSLYGSTYEGGNLSDCDGYGCGVVFKLAPTKSGEWTETVLYNFTSQDWAGFRGGPDFRRGRRPLWHRRI